MYGFSLQLSSAREPWEAELSSVLKDYWFDHMTDTVCPDRNNLRYSITLVHAGVPCWHRLSQSDRKPEWSSESALLPAARKDTAVMTPAGFTGHPIPQRESERSVAASDNAPYARCSINL